MMYPQEFKDAYPLREDDILTVTEITNDPEDDPRLHEQYGDQPLLEFDTDGLTPWLDLDTVTALRDYLNSWIIQHDEHNDIRM